MDAIALKRIGSTTVAVVEGDITRQRVAAVVNAANEDLRHHKGLATAVVRTGGRVIQEESDTWVRDHGPLPVGAAAVTTGGMLHASHVIHAVGPYFGDGSNDAELAAAVVAALDAARDNDLRSVAIPAISAGKRGYPGAVAAEVIVGAVVGWLRAHPDDLIEVRLVGFDRQQAGWFAGALDMQAP